MSEDTTPATEAPSTFCGYYVTIEYLGEIPLTGPFLAAVRTPEGLTLAFVRRAPRRCLRVDAFNGHTEARYYKTSEVEVLGRVVLTGRIAEERRAA